MSSQINETTNKYIDEDGLVELLLLIKGYYTSKKDFNNLITVETDPNTKKSTLVITKNS